MINNRQGGRRRGRGGQRPQGMPGNSGGNARDNRQRGNAAQLLEKYKSLARDAQLAGDRVQTEYYLQFADHYFRVLEENRSRFEDQQSPRRGRRDDDDGDMDGDDDMIADAGDEDGDEAEVRQQPRRRQPRDQNRERGEDRPRREQPNRRPVNEDEGGERIAFAALPPAIGAENDRDEEGAEEAPKPRRRRVRKAVDEGDTESATAA